MERLQKLLLLFVTGTCLCATADIESINYVTLPESEGDAGRIETFRQTLANQVTLDVLFASRHRSDVNRLLGAYEILKNHAENGPPNPAYTPAKALEILQGAMKKDEIIALNEVDVVSSRMAARILLKQFEESPVVMKQYSTLFGADSERELKQAMQNHDLLAAEKIHERYPLTDAALGSLSWKAASHFDKSEWANAIHAFELMKEGKLEDRARRSIDVQLAIAYASIGKKKKAAALMKQFEKDPYIAGSGAKFSSLESLPVISGSAWQSIPTQPVGCVPAPHADEWNAARMLPGTPNQLMLGSKKGEIWKVNLDTGATELVRAFARLIPHQFSADGKQLLTSNNKGTVTVVGLESNKKNTLNFSSEDGDMDRTEVKNPNALFGRVAFASQRGDDGTPEEESHIFSLTTPSWGFHEIGTNGARASSFQFLLRRWSVSEKTPDKKFLDIRANGNDRLYLSDDGKVLVSRDQTTGKPQIWTLRENSAEELTVPLPAHPGQMELIGLSQGGNTVVLGTSQGKISVVNVDSRVARSIAPEEAGLSSMGVSPNGSLSAWGSGSGKVILRGIGRDVENLRTELPGVHPGGVRAIQIEEGIEPTQQKLKSHFIVSFGAADNNVCITKVGTPLNSGELKPVPRFTLDYSTAKKPLPMRGGAKAVPKHQPFIF